MSPHDLVRPRWGARARSPRREDLVRDPVAAGSLGVENLKRVAPNLVSWTSEAGEQALRRTDDEATRVHLEDVRARIDDILEGDEA